MRREERKDRYRGSPNVRFERGKIVFDSGHKEAEAARNSRKVSRVER
jgi:hypothetical protein